MTKITTDNLRGNIYTNRLFFLFLLICTITEICADNRKPYLFSYENQYKSFKNVLLPHDANQVNAIFQDRSGLMWIGTKNGLFSYDGYRIQDYPMKAGPETKTIFSIVQIDSVYLCLGTGEGLLLFNLCTEQYESVNPQLRAVKAVRSLALFDNKLWVGSYNEGLFYYDFEQKLLKNVPSSSEDDKAIIYSLTSTGQKIYIGSYSGLSYYDPKEGKRVNISLSRQYKDLMVNSLLWDENRNSLWVGAEGYLFQYLPKTGEVHLVPSFPVNSFKTLALDGKQDLVIGTDNGFYVYEVESRKLKHIVHDSRNKQSLCNNIIWCVFADKANNVWLGTDRGFSLAAYHSTFHFVHISEITENGMGNQFTSIYGDSKGNYWLGGINGLILMQNISGKEEKTYQIRTFRSEDNKYSLPHDRIRCIYEDRDKDIWIATDGGIARYDIHSGMFIHYNILDATRQKNANWAYDIYEDNKGRLWIATYWGGLFVVNKKKLIASDNRIPYLAEENCSIGNDPASFLSNIVYKIEVDKKGVIWVNTQEGLAKIDPQNNQIEKKKIYLDKMIYDGDNYIWYSTGQVISRFHISSGNNEKVCTLPEGNHVYSFVAYKNKLWFSYTEGVSVLDMVTLQRENISIPNYYYQSCFWDEQHQLLLLGGEDGIACLSTAMTQSIVSQESPIILTSIWNNKRRLIPTIDYEGKSVKYRDELQLPYSTNNLAFEFSRFTYSPEIDRAFYYCLDGTDSTWSKIELAHNRVFLPNLEPGSYTLRLRGESDNPSISPVTSFKITILPPWYRTLYAYVLYVLLFLFVVWQIVWRIQLRIKRRYERMEKAKTIELSNLKMDFFMNISHELKTPLSLIIAPLSKLISETKNRENKQKLELIHYNSLRLNTLIQKILNFKQMEYESENMLIRSHVELCALLQNTIQTFLTVIQERHIELKFTSDVDTLWMHLDILKIESIFINILSNAIKHVPLKDGIIEISLSKRENEVCIRISDNGDGIKEEELALVFVRFFQGRNAKKNQGGTGIGLYLVKKFVELHSGRVEIRSNGGTIVEIILPLIGDNAISVERQLPVEIDVMADVEKANATILIIDDNKEIVAFLAETLSEYYRCITAYNGKEGLLSVQADKPDLIIVDQMMPVMDGFEFCRNIRHNQPTASIPVIMLTAKDDMDTELKSIKMGIDVFVPKPFDMKKLILRITQLLHKRSSIEKSIRIETITQPSFEIEKADSDESLIERITKIVEDNMDNEGFNLSILSEMLGIEQKQLYRKVKQLTGMTPVNYVRQLRMKKAAILMTQNRFTISEVMYLVGYTNASYFSKCFSEMFGVTPKQFIINQNDKNEN